MQRISAWTDLTTPAGQFRYGSVVGGVAPTPLKAEFFNAIQEELANVILAYLPGLQVNDNTQLLQAVRLVVAGNAYSKPQVDSMLAQKANWGITLAAYGIGDAYTKTAADSLLSGKANKTTSLGGYGITDAYTKVATDGLLAGKANNATTLAGYGITDPIWTDSNATPKAIVAQASAEAGGVGTYALLMLGGGPSSFDPLYAGALVAGSSCLYSNTEGEAPSGTPAGTWKLMGMVYNHDSTNPDSVTLCLRVS